MGLLRALFGSARMRDPVRGTARVVGSSRPPHGATHGTARMQVVVEAEGVAAHSTELDAIAPTRKWPSAGSVLPVTVDRANPDKVRVEWDEVSDGFDLARREADALAEAMRQGGGAQAGANLVVDLQGASPADLPPEAEAQLRAAGVDPAQVERMMQAAFGVAAVPQPQQAPPASPGDDTIERLERLARLREGGVLTDAEFEQQKRRILGDI